MVIMTGYKAKANDQDALTLGRYNYAEYAGPTPIAVPLDWKHDMATEGKSDLVSHPAEFFPT